VLGEGVQFSADGKFLALAERRDCKDFISLFDCNSWQLIKVGTSRYYFVCILSFFISCSYSIIGYIERYQFNFAAFYMLLVHIWEVVVPVACPLLECHCLHESMPRTVILCSVLRMLAG